MSLILCCTTWKCYNLLEKLIASAESGNTKPDKIWIVDNGGTFWHDNPKVEIWRPPHNIGVSGGDNFFFKNMGDDFIIVSNDDVELFPYTLTMYTIHQNDGDLLVAGGLPILNAFTLFSVNRKIVDTVGYFDETISPNYAYFEDNDFGRRINLAGLKRFDVPTSAFHATSSTLKALNSEEQKQHAQKFDTARKNYMAKWGGKPTEEKYELPHGNKSLYAGCLSHDLVKVK
jgi:GT2 family glycosyltransferase